MVEAVLKSSMGRMLRRSRRRPSIYDLHTGGGGQAQVDACGREEGVKPHVDVHIEN